MCFMCVNCVCDAHCDDVKMRVMLTEMCAIENAEHENSKCGNLVNETEWEWGWHYFGNFDHAF